MPKKTLVFQDDKSHKFWEVSQTGKTVTTRWGRAGTDGQSKTKEYPTPAAAKADAEKQTAAKQKKGYAAGRASASKKKTTKKKTTKKKTTKKKTTKTKTAKKKTTKKKTTKKKTTKKTNYLEAFKALAAEIDAHEKTVLIHFSYEKPITKTQIKAAEKTYGVPFADEFLAPYREFNGMKLVWMHTGEEDYSPKTAVPKANLRWRAALSSDFSFSYAFMLLPLALALKTIEKNRLWLPREEWGGDDHPPNEVCIFDASHFYYMPGFLLDAPVPNPKIRLGDDWGGVFYESHEVTMSTYLRMVLKSKCIVDYKSNYFSKYGGKHIKNLSVINPDLDNPTWFPV